MIADMLTWIDSAVPLVGPTGELEGSFTIKDPRSFDSIDVPQTGDGNYKTYNLHDFLVGYLDTPHARWMIQCRIGVRGVKDEDLWDEQPEAILRFAAMLMHGVRAALAAAHLHLPPAGTEEAGPWTRN